MALPYSRVNFVDGVTPGNAATFNTLDLGIKDLSDRAPAAAVVNGQWIKGSGGVAVWSAIAESDVTNLVTDLAAKEATANKGVASGYASLDATGKVPSSQLPTSGGPMPIQLHTPRSSTLGGNSVWTVLAQTNYDWGHWEFVKDVDGYVYGQVRVAAAFTAATVILSLAANATTGVTRMQVGYFISADGATINGSFTDITAQDVTVPATAYLRKDVTFALGALSLGDQVTIRVFHAGTHANDTLAVNTLLTGAWLGGS